MALDKKTTTIFIITSIAIAGTVLASTWTTTTTTKTLQLGSSPAISTTSTTTTLSDAKPQKSVVTVATTQDTNLVSVILRILGIPISIEEVTTYRSRNMGYGEITLAYDLAHASGKSVHEILNMRYDQKMGWGKIAKVLGVKLHDSADRSVIILHEAQLKDDADNFIISIRIDLDEDDNNHKSDDDKNNKHNSNKEDDHKKPQNEQEKAHGKNKS